MKFVATKTADQLDLQALHRVRERLVSQRTGIINQIRAFLLERGVAVRQGLRFLRAELPGVLATRSDVLSPRMLRVIEDLAGDWRRLDERIEGLTGEIEALAHHDSACERLMTVPGIGPIISSAMVAAIGTGDVFSKGRDFSAWLGLVPKQISTGDRTILGKISRRGNRYLRVLFVQAAWVVLIRPRSWERYGLKSWIEAAKKRLHHNVLAIALANKLARIAWAVLNKQRAFECVRTDATASRPA
jgi:transposase